MNTPSAINPPRSAGRIRVVIVDDHPWVRLGLTSLLNDDGAFAVCGEAEDAAGALAIMASCAPDLAIVDISLKGPVDGIELTATLKKLYPALAVLVLSMHAEPKYAARALASGASAYIPKSEAPERLISTLLAIVAETRPDSAVKPGAVHE